VAGVRLADAVSTFLATISVPNTRRGYAVPLQRMVADFGPGTDVAGPGSRPGGRVVHLRPGGRSPKRSTPG